MQFKRLYDELKRRNVFRVGIAYAVAGWLIIQVADTVFPRLGLPDWTITFTIALVGLGFPIALIIAWAFELTPDGLKKSDEVVEEHSISEETGKKINRVAIISLSLVIVLLLAERVFIAAPSASGDPPALNEASIAVLPFVNMSPDKENEYFSDGLSEELLNALAQIDGLSVIGRTSSFKFKGSNADIQTIGDELGVLYLLEGSVRKFGDQIRVTAKLINVKTGYNLWSTTYDRELDDVFAIQEEISRNVITELRSKLLPEERVQLAQMPTRDVEAYQMYLKANQLIQNRKPEELEAAIELYESAIRLDNTFAAAYARLANVWYLYDFYGGEVAFNELKEIIRSNAQRALDLNEDLGEGYAAMGAYFFYENQWEDAVDAYERSLELNPSQTNVYNWLGNMLETLGQTELRDEYRRKMIEVEPLAPLSIYNESLLLRGEGKYEEAMEVYRKNLRINPEFTLGYSALSDAYMYSPFGEFDTALEYAFACHEKDPTAVHCVGDIIEASYNLGLDAIADEFQKFMFNNFSMGPEPARASYLYSLYTGDFSSLSQIIQMSLNEDFVIPDEEYYEAISIYALTNSEVDLALSEIHRFAPEYQDPESLELRSNTDDIIYYYTSLMREADMEEEKILQMQQVLCDYAYEPGKTKDRPFFVVSCELERGDPDEALTYLRKSMIENRNLNQALLFFELMPQIKAVADQPGYQALQQEIREDLSQQRERAVAYLKKEGHWKEGWALGD